MAPPSEPPQPTTRGMLVGGVGAHPHAVCVSCARRVEHALRPGPPHRWALRGEPEGPALKVVASWPSARCWGPVRHGAGLVVSPQNGARGPNKAYVLQGSIVPLGLEEIGPLRAGRRWSSQRHADCCQYVFKICKLLYSSQIPTENVGNYRFVMISAWWRCKGLV